MSPHIHLAVIAIPFSVFQEPSPCFASTFAKGQLWSSKSGEFHPDDRTLLHFQVSLVTCPLLVEPSIPRGPPMLSPATDRTRVFSWYKVGGGVCPITVRSEALTVSKHFHFIVTSECCSEILRERQIFFYYTISCF